VLPNLFDTPGINEFVLDYANRNMAGIEFLKNLPKDKTVQVGVLDVRSNAIETPQTIAARIKKAIAAVGPERVVLSTDCGMKPLARMVAKMKLHSLGEAARMVRKEIGA
jgi:5-methyltetrahydropteroyltriglutamate--homocysteine methyltransferase